MLKSVTRARSKALKIKKGDLVMVDDAFCFTTQNGGERLRWDVLSTSGMDDNREVHAFYKLNESEFKKLRNSSYYRGMGCDGEPRVATPEGIHNMKAGIAYPVIKARARTSYGFYQKSNLAIVLDLETGRELYVSRALLKKVEV